MSRNYNRESGHAALLFVMLCPFLLGIFIIGSDGARAMLDKARLEEASEAAVLALSAQNSDVRAEQEALAKKYIKAYFGDEVNITTLNVNRTVCEVGDGCQDAEDTAEQHRYFEYQLEVAIEQDRWFSTSSDTSLGDDNYTVAGQGLARRNESDAMDVILVADYSASMYDNWNGGAQKKFQDLNDVMKYIARDLKKYNESVDGAKTKLAIVPFDFYTSEGQGESRRFKHHLVCNGRCESNDNRSYRFKYKRPDLYVNIDYSTTVDRVFIETNYDLEKSDVTNISVFETIGLSSSVDEVIASIDFFTIPNPQNTHGSGTSFYAGLIRAAQIANNGENPKKLIIILSDGDESSSTITQNLVSSGLCSYIENTLKEKEVLTSDGTKSMKVSLAAIGFDYDVYDNPELKNCVGEENVYKAESTEQIKNKILTLISEEIGHLAL